MISCAYSPISFYFSFKSFTMLALPMHPSTA